MQWFIVLQWSASPLKHASFSSLVVPATLLLAVMTACGYQQEDISPLRLATVFRQITIVQDKKLNEISGIVPSSDGRGIWALNDSGGKSELYLLDRQGKRIQTVDVKGAKQRDWEDLAKFQVDRNSFLAIADTGNNQLKDQTSRLYIVAEPNSKDEKIELEARLVIHLRFPEHNYDCESVAVSNGMIYLATKASAAGGIQHSKSLLFGFPMPQLPSRPGTTEVVGQLIGEGPLPFATGMDTNQDQTALVIRDYLSMAVYQKKPTQTWREVLVGKPSSRFPGPFQKQAEAVCFSDDGKQIWTISEGVNPTWWSAELEKEENDR